MGNPQKEEVLIVGDSLSSDILGGYRYGIDTCWFNPQGKSCELDIDITYEVKELGEVQEFLLPNKVF